MEYAYIKLISIQMCLGTLVLSSPYLCLYLLIFKILIISLLTQSYICSFSTKCHFQNVKLKESFRKLNTITSCILFPKEGFLICLFKLSQISQCCRETITKTKLNWKVKNNYQCYIRKLNIFFRFNKYENGLN